LYWNYIINSRTLYMTCLQTTTGWIIKSQTGLEALNSCKLLPKTILLSSFYE